MLELDRRLQLREVEPESLRAELRAAVRAGARRVVVCGGDGSIAAAAAELAGTATELAILPAGTLNHFARDHNIPTELDRSLEVALDGRVERTDVGEVNGRVFLNTFSVGSYVRFVSRRERLERWAGYRAASFLAGLAVLADLRSYSVQIEVAGRSQSYTSPLVFVGVGERDLSVPKLGRRMSDGAQGLHTLVVTSRTRARLLTLTLAAAARGAAHAARAPSLDSFLVQHCTVNIHRSTAKVALDGELVRLVPPLRVRLRAGVLKVVVPHPSSDNGGEAGAG